MEMLPIDLAPAFNISCAAEFRSTPAKMMPKVLRFMSRTVPTGRSLSNKTITFDVCIASFFLTRQKCHVIFKAQRTAPFFLYRSAGADRDGRRRKAKGPLQGASSQALIPAES